MADLHHQPASRRQMIRRFRENPPHQVQSVTAAVQRQFRFMPVFGGQAPHRGIADVGRIAEDQFITPARQRREQVGAQQAQAGAQPVVADVAPRNRERFH